MSEIKDLKDLTVGQFRDPGPPSPRELSPEQQPTGFALHVLRLKYGPDLIFGWKKWGMAVVKDVVALGYFSSFRAISSDDSDARAVSKTKLVLVDWDIIDSLLKQDYEGYEEFCRASGEGIETLPIALEALEYELKGRFPGVSVPGDLYAVVTGTAATS